MIKKKTARCGVELTTSMHRTLKFWDTRSPNPMLSIDLPERAYCADVDFPMAVVGTASKGIIIYQLDGQPKEFKKVWWSILQ